MKMMTFWDIVPCSAVVIDVSEVCTASVMRAMVEVVHTSETSVCYNETAWRYILEDYIILNYIVVAVY
jgi:hypothetical protein